MDDIKEEKITRYRSKDGKFSVPKPKAPEKKPWYADIPTKQDTKNLPK